MLQFDMFSNLFFFSREFTVVKYITQHVMAWHGTANTEYHVQRRWIFICNYKTYQERFRFFSSLYFSFFLLAKHKLKSLGKSILVFLSHSFAFFGVCVSHYCIAVIFCWFYFHFRPIFNFVALAYDSSFFFNYKRI